MSVLNFSFTVAPIAAPVAVLSVRLTPLAVLHIASEVERAAQLNTEVAIYGTGLQFEVGNVWVGGEMKGRNLAACWVILLSHSTADAGGHAGFTRRAVVGSEGYDGELLERVGSRMEPAAGEK